jgi:hypothetical protein
LLSPTLDVPLVPGKSAAWCATMQMAWDALAELNGGPLLVASEDPQAAAIASARFPLDWVDYSSVLVRSGPITDGFIARTREAARRKFNVEPELLDNLGSLQRGVPSAGAFAMLKKDLAFAIPFERYEENWLFLVLDESWDHKQQPVNAFGVRNEKGQAQAAKQVKILWRTPIEEAMKRQGDMEVVVELAALPVGDRLILASFHAPPTTLGAAVTVAINRVNKPNTRIVTKADFDELQRRAESLKEEDIAASPPISLADQMLDLVNLSPTMNEGERFAMPIIRIDAQRRFGGLEGPVVSPGGRLQSVALAEQLVRFNLDEKGMHLSSEGAAGGLFGMEPRSLEFDQPFLLMLARRGAPRPYFALWVGGPDVLELSANQPEPRKPGEGLLGDRMPGASDPPPATTDTESPTTQQADESPTTQP